MPLVKDFHGSDFLRLNLNFSTGKEAFTVENGLVAMLTHAMGKFKEKGLVMAWYNHFTNGTPAPVQAAQ